MTVVSGRSHRVGWGIEEGTYVWVSVVVRNSRMAKGDCMSD